MVRGPTTVGHLAGAVSPLELSVFCIFGVERPNNLRDTAGENKGTLLDFVTKAIADYNPRNEILQVTMMGSDLYKSYENPCVLARRIRFISFHRCVGCETNETNAPRHPAPAAASSREPCVWSCRAGSNY